MADSFKDLSNLVFFTEKGYEIPITKTYTIEWEIIPHDLIRDNFITNPKGHFMFNLEDNSIETVIDDGGKLLVKPTNIYFSNNEKQEVSTYNDILCLDTSLVITNRGRNPKSTNSSFVEDIYNTVKITFNTLTVAETKEIPISIVFDKNNIIDSSNNSVDWEGNIIYTYHTLKDIQLFDTSFAEADDEGNIYDNIIDAILKSNFEDQPEIVQAFYPGVRYMGAVHQDKVSEDFIAASTIIILELNGDSYERPIFTENPNFNFHFEFQNDSEMKFISSDSIATLIWNDSYTAENTPGSFDTLPNLTTSTTTSNMQKFRETPIHFTVGFTAELEACYQNIMAMFILDNRDPENQKRYLLGLITFFTEVVGEDERYRALLGNLGIPDPVNYPNIFKEQDPDEQGTDWTLINRKSKELMINYDNIFPYVGTYKALAGAVKFLGYYDLIFKEWYRIKNQNGRDKFITLQTYDIQKEETLESKLKRINVTFGDFERYKKLNRLCMIYHLNDIDDITGEYFDKYDFNTGELVENKFIQLPITYRIYEYRTDEILSKLYSVKNWLEKHILGVNCYISDICGEGIIIERLKSPAYVTLHLILDFESTGKFTPKIVSYTDFQDSLTVVTCTLSEFTNLTLEDYEYNNIETFIHKTIETDNETIYVSSPLLTLVPAIEYQFKLTSENIKSGTLVEFADSNSVKNPILIEDATLKLFNDYKTSSSIDKNELPIIEIYQANLRSTTGDWNNNICYSIQIVADPYTDKSYYLLTDVKNNQTKVRTSQKIVLTPMINNINNNSSFLYGSYSYNTIYGEGNISALNSTFKYTTETKWHVPVIMISNYVCQNIDEVIEGSYILELIRGRLLFRNKNSEITDGKCYGAEVSFDIEANPEINADSLAIKYMYLSDRTPIYLFNSQEFNDNISLLDNTESSYDASVEQLLEESLVVNDFVDISINRVGLYNIQVNAYDQYNTVYNNKSSKITTINPNNIAVDMIVNTEFMKNKSDFYDTNTYGTKLSTADVSTLLLDISTNSSIPSSPRNYKIYDIDLDPDVSNGITYNILSYAEKIPVMGDFIIFNNFTEEIKNIVELNPLRKYYTINLIQDSPNFTTVLNSSYIGICLYDNIKKEIIEDYYPYTVLKINKRENNGITNVSINVIDNPSVGDTSVYTSLSSVISTLNLNPNIYGYIYNATEIILDSSVITPDYDNKITYILDNKQHFIKDLNIKICYASDREIHNYYTQNSVDNETTYKIINVSINTDNTCIYTLNGIVDLYKLNNKLYHNNAEHSVDTIEISKLTTTNPYKIKLCPAHLNAALYILRVADTAYNYVLSYNSESWVKVSLTFEDKPLLFRDYIDTVYSAAVYNYDPLILLHIFINPNTLYDTSTDLYLYRDFPITINKGRTVILRPLADQTVLTNHFNNIKTPMKVYWNWKSYVIDDITNTDLSLDLTTKQLIFKSINPILTVQPELLGPQSPEMTCIDIYGNKIVNYADGFIYVNTDKINIYNKAEVGTRSIYYKDVYIVGFEYSIFNNYVMSADGETTTFEYIDNNTYSSTKGNSDTQKLLISYKIYYNDGTVEENTGASVNLLNNGKKTRFNKVKVKLNASSYPHKHENANIETMFKFDKTNERDLIKDEQIVNIGIEQYGYSKTTKIYNLTYDIKHIPSTGISELNNYTLNEYITNIQYTLERSEGEIETISGETLQECNLLISKFTYMDKLKGTCNSIDENYIGTKLIGMLDLTVLFYVNGITDIIQTSAYTNVYQD